MGVLARCWLIIEFIVIPDGFVKWFYLSFYIHPILLFFCQIFLWLKLLFYPAKIICHLILYLLKIVKNCLMWVWKFTRLSGTAAMEEVEIFEDAQTDFENEIVILHDCSSTATRFFSLQPKVLKFEKDWLQADKDLVEKGPEDDIDAVPHEEQSREETSFWLDDYLRTNDNLFFVYSPGSSTDDTDSDEHLLFDYSSLPAAEEMVTKYEDPSSVCSSSSPVLVMEMERITDAARNEETDAFYLKYAERMNWFDLLNHERTCGISAILNKQVGTPYSLESVEPVVGFLGTPFISWSKMSKKRLLKSLESDFELVYVAQSCLSWEALHHQYRKVETLSLSTTSQNGVFQDNVAGEFQKFQILLERFMEDERCEGKRIWNYTEARFSLRSLLQVPEITGFLEQEKEDLRGEAINVKQVLKIIEKCMEAFWVFVKTDNKRSWWKLKSSLWTNPPVEDPRDLELLADLTRKLRKKEILLKDLQGKQRCWVRRVVNQLEESQRKQMLFTMIDMKLVARVLQMPVISSMQLRWCKEKLDNIGVKQGKIIRTCNSGPLFPS